MEFTINLMCSEDYRERFKAEYYQLLIRGNRLDNFISKCKTNPDTKHDCPISLLERQLNVMKEYIAILDERMIYENIKLEEDVKNGK